MTDQPTPSLATALLESLDATRDQAGERPPFDVNAALEAVLAATRDKVRASRLVDLWRDRLDREARRRYALERSAPAWNTPGLGKVRLDPKPASAHVTDPGELATYVLGISPDNVTATVELAGADLEEALSALDFAGIKVTRSTAEVRPAYLGPFLKGLTVVDDPDAPEVLRVDEVTGVADRVPGVGVTPAGAQLTVTLDAALKRQTLAEVDHEVAELEDPVAPTCDNAEHIAAGLHKGSRCDAPPSGALSWSEALASSTTAPLPPALAAAIEAGQLTVASQMRVTAPGYTARPGLAPTDTPRPTAPTTTPLTVEVLASYTSDVLKRAARAYRLPTSGTKAALAARILEHAPDLSAAKLKELSNP